jgi:rhamnosyltransferase subunit B
MARIVIATFGSLGDLHPALAVALELRRRGHDVGIATSEGYRDRVGALGLGFFALRPPLQPDDIDLIRRVMNGPKGARLLLRDLMLPAVRDMYEDLRQIVTAVDLLVTSELVYAAATVVEQTGVRWATYALAPLSMFSAHDISLPDSALVGGWMHRLRPSAAHAIHGVARIITYSWWRPLRRLRRELGLSRGPNPFLREKFSPQLNLAMFSSVLQLPQPDWPRSTIQTGFAFHEQTTAPLPDTIETFLAAGEPPIVFTLGSSAVSAAGDFYRQSAAAAQAVGRRALLLIGKNAPPPDLPPSILTWDYLPYAQIFPRAGVIVHQAGVGTTAEALRAGKPMLCVPFGFDQPDNAARIVRPGAGRCLPRRRYNFETALRALTALLHDSAYAATSARLASRVKSETGVASAANALLALLAVAPTKK